MFDFAVNREIVHGSSRIHVPLVLTAFGNQTPLSFKTINAPLNAAHFLNDTSPKTDPDDE